MKSSHVILAIGLIGTLLLVTVMTDQFLKHPLISQIQELKTSLKNKYPSLQEFSLILRQPSVKNLGTGLVFDYTHIQSSEPAIEAEMDQIAQMIWKEVMVIKEPPFLKEKNNSLGNDKKDLKSRLDYVLIKNQTKEKKFMVEGLKQKMNPFPITPKKENFLNPLQKQPFPKK